MIKELIVDLEIKILSALLTAVAAAITLVAMAFGIYTGFRMLVIAPAAAGLTALVFATITALIGLIAPRLARKPKPEREELKPKAHPMVTVAEIGGLAAALSREWLKSRARR